MKPTLRLPPATGDLVAAASAFHAAIVRDLFPGAGGAFRGLAVVEDDGAHGAPAWTEADGEIQIAEETAAALAGDVQPWAVEALAHQLFHGVGGGPAFPFRTDALLEEAIAETLMQAYRSEFLEAFDLQDRTGGPPAFAVGCDRLRTIAGGDAVALALALKPLDPVARADELAARDVRPAPFAGDPRVAEVEAVTLLSVPPSGAVAAALGKAAADPAVAHAVRRSLDYGLHIGWARDIHAHHLSQ